MSIPRVTVNDVGSLWLGPDGEPWRLIAFCEYPSVTWERLTGLAETFHKEQRGGAVGSPITDGFRRLVEAEE